MSEITNQKLHEICLSARSVAEEEVDSQGIFEPEVVDLPATWLFDRWDAWASFDKNSKSGSYEAVIAAFFGESATTRAFAGFFGVRR